MNPLDELKIALRLRSAVNAAKEESVKTGKSLLTSKMFWANVLGTAVQVGGIVPPKYGVPLMGFANIALRYLTNQPITGIIVK